MPGARFARLCLFATLTVAVLGCATVTPAPSGSSGPSSAESGAASTSTTPASDAPASITVPTPPLGSAVPASVLPSSLPTTAPPTVAPTAQPTSTPKPTVAAAPNLVIGKFDIDADFILAETPVDAVFTIKNSGTSDAGPFKAAVLETNTDEGVKGSSDSFSVDGLAAGKSVKVTISMALPKAGNWKLAATADTEDAVTESNEKDNANEVAVKVLAGLPDLQWFKDGFSIFDQNEVAADGHKIELEAKFTNDGTAAYDTSPFVIGMTWYRDEDSASGNLDPFSYADVMDPGATADLTKIDFLPGAGTYTIYAYIDDGRVVDELSEDNNETSAKITIP